MEWIVMLIKALAATAGGLLALWGGYYLVSGLMCWRGQRPFPVRPARTKFAVLIAARNEELVIGPLINSLLMQDYPPERYDIWVIPNNCTDHTARAAAGFGARVLKCDRPVKSKGEVLRFAYARLRGRRYDACCVFDADNVVDSRFLREMDLAYQAGAGAAQGYRDSKNPYDTPMSGCYSIYYWMMDRFYNQSRAAVGLSAMINGTGFMVAARVLETLNLSIPAFGMVKDDRHRTRALVHPDGREIGIQAIPAVFALVGQIQEETHRFAIEYHRQLQAGHMRTSALDDIPGVGEKRRAQLLRQFKSIKAIRAASLEELQKTLPKNAAQAVYQHFRTNK